MRLRVGVVAALLAGALVSADRPGHTKGPEIFPLSEVKAGLKGHILTVLQGTIPERIEFEVIGVIKKAFPRMDLVLVKSVDPKLKDIGIARGMSGSPLYVDGKVVCAVSYAYNWAKVTVGGCTPIENMIKDAARPMRGPDAMSMASLDEFRRVVPSELVPPAREQQAWLERALPPRPAVPAGESGLVRVGVPISVSGFGPSAFEATRKLFQPYNLEPMQAGGAGEGARGPTKFEAGSNIAVDMMRGDMSMAGICAVSYIDASLVWGCGHPMFHTGEMYAPISTAEIHITMPTLNVSWKYGSPLRQIGSLTQDRQSMIHGDTSRRARMVPVDIKVRHREGEQVFHADVIAHRFLSPQLITLALTNAIQSMAPDVTDATLTIRSTLTIKGFAPLSFTDYLYSADGMSAGALSMVRGLRFLQPLMFNAFKPLRLDHVQLEADITYKADFAKIEAIRLPQLSLPAGVPTYVDVVLRPYNGKEYVTRIPLTLPARLAGSTVKIEVVPGDQARLDAPAAESLEAIVETLRTKTFPANVLVLTVLTPDEGVALDGRVLPDLPDSALDTVRKGTTSKKVEAYRSLLRAKVVPLTQVVQGRQELTVKIDELK